MNAPDPSSPRTAAAPPPGLIDIGANLGHESFDHDRERVLEAARHAGVEAMIITGTSIPDSDKAAALAALLPGCLFSTAGIHPHEAAAFGSDSPSQLLEIAAQPQVVAMGETGLDFNRDFSPRPAQERAFAEQLGLAARTGLPVFLHQRDAHTRFLAILKEQRDALTRGVVHCFTGTRDELYDYLDLDMYIGITGWVCDERRGLHVQELLHDIPADRLMLETDAPYLLPRNMRPRPSGRRNEPAFLPWVLRLVAERLGCAEAVLAERTSTNARRFFALDAAGVK